MKLIIKPALLILAVLVCLAMLRLGIWQLDRADEKQVIVDQVTRLSQAPNLPLEELLDSKKNEALQRYQPVSVRGQYQQNSTLFVENQVLDGRVGFLVFTLFVVSGDQASILVNRGWIPAQAGQAPPKDVAVHEGVLSLSGRLNTPPAQPPLWDDAYSVNSGNRWQYLPLDQFSQQIGRDVLPLVLELSPDVDHPNSINMIRKWQAVNDQQVNMHKAYALQWFAMSLAFFIACLVLFLKTMKGASDKA